MKEQETAEERKVRMEQIQFLIEKGNKRFDWEKKLMLEFEATEEERLKGSLRGENTDLIVGMWCAAKIEGVRHHKLLIEPVLRDVLEALRSAKEMEADWLPKIQEAFLKLQPFIHDSEVLSLPDSIETLVEPLIESLNLIREHHPNCDCMDSRGIALEGLEKYKQRRLRNKA